MRAPPFAPEDSAPTATMLAYAVCLLALLLVLYNNGNFSPANSRFPQMHRTPRPQVKEELLALDDWPANLTCGDDHGYKVYLVSKEPLVVYVEGFLDPAERAHLLEIRLSSSHASLAVPNREMYREAQSLNSPITSAQVTPRHKRKGAQHIGKLPGTTNQPIAACSPSSESLFEPSTITHDGGAATHRDQTIRDSVVAVLPRTEVVRCIEARARAFQGWRGEQWLERLRTQRYRSGGHYNHHYDWSSSYGGWGRVGSFMVWVADIGHEPGDHTRLEGGGTEFPLLKRPSGDEKWCRFVECDQKAADGELGIVFKVIAGNAVYWENFRPDGTGRGWEATWHAGLPVLQGTKVGLNIWTWGRID